MPGQRSSSQEIHHHVGRNYRRAATSLRVYGTLLPYMHQAKHLPFVSHGGQPPKARRQWNSAYLTYLLQIWSCIVAF